MYATFGDDEDIKLMIVCICTPAVEHNYNSVAAVASSESGQTLLTTTTQDYERILRGYSAPKRGVPPECLKQALSDEQVGA